MYCLSEVHCICVNGALYYGIVCKCKHGKPLCYDTVCHGKHLKSFHCLLFFSILDLTKDEDGDSGTGGEDESEGEDDSEEDEEESDHEDIYSGKQPLLYREICLKRTLFGRKEVSALQR